MKEKLWTRSYLFVILTSTLQNGQMQMVNPLMSKYATSLGIDMNIVGILVGLMSISALLARPASGRIADRFENRRVAAVSGLLMGLSTLGCLVAGERIALLFVFRFLYGVAFSICTTTIMRMASYLIPASRIGEGMGYFGLGQVLATAVSPGIGIMLADTFSYTTTFLASSLIAVALSVMTLFITMPEGHKKAAPAGSGMKNLFTFKLSEIVAKEAVIFAAIAAAISFANGMESSFMVQFGEGMGVSGVGTYFTVSAIVVFLTRATTSKLVDKKGLAFVLLPGLILVTASMALLFVTGSVLYPMGISGTMLFVLLLVCASLKAVGQGSGQPAIQAKTLQVVPESRRGLASSTYYMGCDIGQGFGPMIGGVIAGSMGFAFSYLSAAVVVAGGLVLFLCTRKKLDCEAPEAS